MSIGRNDLVAELDDEFPDDEPYLTIDLSR